jgi:CheY-like chemotaxis protein
MPEMDGFQATRAIRQLEREALFPGPAPSPRVVIVALTGLADAKSRDEAYKAGVDDFLTKPVNFRMIAELFEKWKQKRMGGGNQGVENEIE